MTLTGVGGVGKTRLALEVAARVGNDFPDGVWVIELAPVGDPAAVPEAVAAVLGITQQPGMSLADSVAAALEGRSRLLVFDNCEHVLDAAADMIEAILAALGDREDPRDQPRGAAAGRRTTLAGTVPGHRLERRNSCSSSALRQWPPPPHSTDDADAVIEICRRLDGIPLAIELAASRLLSMTVIEIRDLLDDRFRLLVGSRRGLERHQTLRHAVQWSYDLLDDDEKALLNRCSVFAGGFDLAGACAVAGSGDEFATLDLLDALVRKSLVVADQSSGRTRFSMLETIRQFAEEQLVHAGEADDTRTAHARYFAGREADVLALWDSPRQREAYTGSPSSSRICAPHSAGPPTTTTSTPLRLSPFTRHSLALESNSTSRLHGPRNSSNPRGLSNIVGWHSSTAWPHSATQPAGVVAQSVTPTPP